MWTFFSILSYNEAIKMLLRAPELSDSPYEPVEVMDWKSTT